MAEPTHPELRFLPPSSLEMMFPQLEHVISRERVLAAERVALTDELQVLLNAIEPRATDDAQTMGELATPEDGDRLGKLMQRSEEVEVAFDALHAYMAPLRAAASEGGA